MGNIIGTSYSDVYTFYSKIFNDDIQSIFTFVEESLLPFLSKNPFERDQLNAFFAIDYVDEKDINLFTVKNFPDSFQAAMLALPLPLPLVAITHKFGIGIANDKKFQGLLNKCYHFVRFTRLFSELNLPRDLFSNRSAIKTQLMTLAHSAGKPAFTHAFM